MANNFKVTTVASVATTVGANTAKIYTCPGSTTMIVLALMLTNKHTSSIDTSVVLSSNTDNPAHNDNNNSGNNADVFVIKDVTIDEQSSLEIMAGQKYVLEDSDELKVYADNANIDVTLSYMEITA